MKYIRVIEDCEEYITTREFLHDHILALQDCGFDFEGGIIKESDNLEELFDEYILYNFKNKDHDVHSYYSDYIVEHYDVIKEWIKLYGVILVEGEHDEPILKSVAKMKGVLPNGEIDWELL